MSRPLSHIDAGVASRLLSLALARGGDYADLFFEHRVTGHFVFENGALAGASRLTGLGLGVRVQQGEATGYASVDHFDWEAMAQAARTASAIARGGGCGVVKPAFAERDASDDSIVEGTIALAAAEKRVLLERAARAAAFADPRVRHVESNLSEEDREIIIATSDGRFARDRQPLLRFAVRVIVEREGKRQEGASGGGGRLGLRYFDECSPEWHAAEAVRHAIVMLDAVPAPAGVMDVVLAPGDSGILLHETVGHGLEGDYNRQGTSRYAGLVGQPVASPLCTVVDDATLPGARGSITVDDEGHPGRLNVLIERGRLAGYLHDRQTAAHFACAPTGNGRRAGYDSAPMPRMTSTLLLAGPHAPDEIVGSVAHGLYARKLGGGQVDIGNGNFVFAVTEGYLIEDGRLTTPVAGANLVGNGADVLRRVSMLGDDLRTSDGIWSCAKLGQHVPVGVGCPTVRVSALTVGGTKLRGLSGA